MNKDGSVLNWNQGMQDIVGYSDNEVIGKKFNVFFSANDASSYSIDKVLSTSIKKGKVTVPGTHCRKDGTVYRGSIIVEAIKDDDKSLIGFDLQAKANR